MVRKDLSHIYMIVYSDFSVCLFASLWYFFRDKVWTEKLFYERWKEEIYIYFIKIRSIHLRRRVWDEISFDESASEKMNFEKLWKYFFAHKKTFKVRKSWKDLSGMFIPITTTSTIKCSTEHLMDYLEAVISSQPRQPRRNSKMPLQPRTSLHPITIHYTFRRHSSLFTTHKWRQPQPLLSVSKDPHNWKVISIQRHRFTIHTGESPPSYYLSLLLRDYRAQNWWRCRSRAVYLKDDQGS